MKTKICKKCKRNQIIDNFYVDKHTKDGYRFYCKMCEKEIRRENRKRRKDIIKEQEHIKYMSNREKEKKRSLSYYYKHRQERMIKMRKYNKKLKEKKEDPIIFEIEVDCELITHNAKNNRKYKFPHQLCNMVVGTCKILKVEKKDVVVKERFKGSEREKEYQKNYRDVDNKTERRKAYMREYNIKYRKNKET